MAQTLIEKIAQRYSVGLDAGHVVRSGDFLNIRPAYVMTHDNTAAVIPKFEKMGARRIKDPAQPVFALDHDIQNTSPENLGKYARIESFAKRHGVAFYPAGRGIGHQVMVEEGYVLPGTFVVGSDSHSNLYGAMGALGTPVVRTDAAAIWATGQTWWQVPGVVRVTLVGSLQRGVVGKDVIIALCGIFNHDEVLNCCIEFSGSGVAGLSIEERLTISNMTTEWGALAGIFPYDSATREYLLGRVRFFEARGDAPPRLNRDVVEKIDAERLTADADAFYAKDLELDLSAVRPFVSGPNTVKTITPLPELEARGVHIDKAYLMSCVNARLQDFEVAAGVLAGRKVADHVEFYIAAASDEVEHCARERGYWQTLVQGGAIELPPGCGACIGLGRGTLKAGEVGISATNRNFKGRMGSPEALVYLASPAVVVASAIAGKIASPVPVAEQPPTNDEEPRASNEEPQASARADVQGEQPSDVVADSQRSRKDREIGSPATGPIPRAGQQECFIKSDARHPHIEDLKRSATCRVHDRPSVREAKVAILPGFPERIEGELLYLPADNLNTDGIYGKDYTYKDGMTAEEMAAVAMENYDLRFQELAKQGDILVGGTNFGTGSSREQAATALKFRGMQMIIAGSFSQTYKRNAFNNGFIVIECPALIAALKAAYQDDKSLTIRTGLQVSVDFVKSQISLSTSVSHKQEEPHTLADDSSEEPRASARADVGFEQTAITDELPDVHTDSMNWGTTKPPTPMTEPRRCFINPAVNKYSFFPLGEVAQELIVKGGFEAVIAERIRE